MNELDVYNIYLAAVLKKEEEMKAIIAAKQAWGDGIKQLLSPLRQFEVYCEDAPNGHGLLVYKSRNVSGFVIQASDLWRGISFDESLVIEVIQTKDAIGEWVKPLPSETKVLMSLRDFIVKCADAFGRFV